VQCLQNITLLFIWLFVFDWLLEFRMIIKRESYSMKYLVSRLSLVGVLCVAVSAEAQAANVYYTSRYVTGSAQWVLKWSNLTDCDVDAFFTGIDGLWTITVSGVAQAEVRNNGAAFYGTTPRAGEVNIPGPNGTLDSATLAGKASFACGSDTIVIGTAPAVSAPVTTVPTLTEWGMMAMGTLIAGFGAMRLRRRERLA